MYRHSAESIKESSRKMFVSLEEKTKYNNYENILRSKNDSYSKTEVDNKIKELSDNTYGTVESTYVSESNTLDGYVKDLEILGNTVQNQSDLADIRSVGELQEDGTYKMSIVSHGKNLFNPISINILDGKYVDASNGNIGTSKPCKTIIFDCKENTSYYVSNINQNRCVIRFVNKNDEIISYTTSINRPFLTPIGCVKAYIFLANEYMPDFKYIETQIEEGTTATSYEPYKESRVDINLPCQLEKVGDISDRLYYDNTEKAWCIEKNIETYYPEIEKIYNYANLGNTFRVSSNASDELVKPKIIGGICNVLPEGHTSEWGNDKECCYVSNSNLIVIKGNINNASNLEEARTWITTTGLYVKYATKEPQKIILPLDVQIQLNSYANKTHIYTVSGDIEPTIKAVLPKSLGASVQSLNEKTDIMLNRLENVEKLKEGQNLSYESNKGYAVCENTNNGYIDNVKIEGKTLVNLCPWKFTSDEWIGGTTYWFHLNYKIPRLEVGKTYSFCAFIDCSNFNYISLGHANGLSPSQVNVKELGKFYKFTATEITERGITVIVHKTIEEGFTDLEKSSLKAIIVEGDYEGYECSYFEGLMSVGEDTDKIEVLTNNKNLFTGECDITVNSRNAFYKMMINNSKRLSISYNGEKIGSGSGQMWVYLSNTYSDSVNHDVLYQQVVSDNKGIEYIFSNNITIDTSKYKYLYLSSGPANPDGVVYKNIQIEEGNNVTYYELNKSHTKSLLYYNESGELVPVPELHEWDSIEKHNDGKWYYHKRSEKVVLNGSEEWSHYGTNVNTIRYAYNCYGKLYAQGLCDIIPYKHSDSTDTFHCRVDGAGKFVIWMDISKLSTGDITGFKSWLSSNNVTVVYELAEEQVYECVNLNLDTYDNETMVMCNSGAILPKLSFNVSSHIGNTVSILRERLKQIEEEYIDYKTTQDKLLLTTIYSSDRGSYSVSTLSTDYDYQELEEIDYELFEITKSVIEVGLNNYNITDMEELIDFYTLVGKFDYDMADVLFEMIENQINPPVIEIPEEEIEILPEI